MDKELEIALRGVEFKKIVDNIFEGIRKEHSLKKIEVEVLYALASGDGFDTPTEIAKHFKFGRGHVSQAIDSLLRRQLITAVPDCNDRRYIHYCLTPEAKGIVEEINRTHTRLEQQIFKGITEEELKYYKAIMAKIFSNIREIVGE